MRFPTELGKSHVGAAGSVSWEGPRAHWARALAKSLAAEKADDGDEEDEEEDEEEEEQEEEEELEEEDKLAEEEEKLAVNSSDEI